MRKYMALAALLAAGGFFRAHAASPSFEVASVKPAAPCCANGSWRESKVFEDRIDFRYVTLKYCLAFAYRVKEYQVAGPPWVGDARFDIVAKGPEGTRRHQLPQMLQALLAARFNLAAHNEKKEYSIFALLAGKTGPKLKEAPPPLDPEAGAKFGIGMNGAVGRIEARNADMLSLCNTLPRFVGRPVVDFTGIEGRYDFDLEFAPEDMHAIAPAPAVDHASLPTATPGVSIFDSIQRLGLKLDARKMQLDTIVVDRADRTPIEN